jgi:tetratricopeptide (TPR) repeat protein
MVPGASQPLKPYFVIIYLTGITSVSSRGLKMTKSISSKILLSLAIFAISSIDVLACTMFKITRDGKTIVGNNEDWSNPHSRVWFEAGKENEYGVAYVGFSDLNPQGAFNEAGLVYDIFAMPHEEITAGKHKLAQPDDFLKVIMRTSSTVEDVKETLEAHNLEGFEKVMLLFIDKSGKYLIQERDELTLGEEPHYVLSNFSPTRITDHSTVELPHFQRGRDLLQHNANLKVSFCEAVLDGLHQEVPYWGGTQYSTLYDLNDSKFNLYYFHDYNRSVQFDLKEELAKGDRVLSIPDMFPEVVKGHEYKLNYDDYEKNLILLESENTFSDPELLASVVRKIKNGPPKKMIYANYYKIESIGKQWLAMNQYENAISVFNINASVFDWIAGPFENLAHAYLLAGQYEMAIENYNRILEILPGDENATLQLQKLQGQSNVDPEESTVVGSTQSGLN